MKKVHKKPPYNLSKCLEWLESELTEKDKAEFKTAKPIELHHSVGRYLRNKLDLWSFGSPMKAYFEKLGLFHPDDMSAIILDAFSARLLGKPFDLDKEVLYYKTYWEKVNKIPANRMLTVKLGQDGRIDLNSIEITLQ